MFKQVLTKLFSSDLLKSSPSNQNIKTYQHRPPIYNPVPTISSCFQQQSSIADSLLTNYYNNTDLNKSNHTESQTQISQSSSVSSISPRSISCSSQENSNLTLSRTTSKNFTPTPPSSSNLKNSHQIYIAPHCIKYTNSTLDDTIYRIDDESLNDIATEILESDSSPPKLQIVFYDNKYFAINNSHLQIYKQMQYVGLITHVQADVISVETIPLPLRKHLLQTPSNLASSNSDECDEDEDEEEAEDGSVLNANDDSFDSRKNNRSIKLNGLHSKCSSTSSGIISDIITQANIDRISKSILVDETYEFGLSENCVESDKEEGKEVDEEDNENDFENYDDEDYNDDEEGQESNGEEYENEENLPSFEKVRMINKLIAQKILQETSQTNKIELTKRVNNISNKIEQNENIFKDVNETYTSEDLKEDNGKSQKNYFLSLFCVKNTI